MIMLCKVLALDIAAVMGLIMLPALRQVTAA
jgi:hypothetical protein